ncbi:hypothetical protein H8958_016916 [Nasalis larvatus]
MKDKEGEEYQKKRGDHLVGSERKSLCYLTCIASTCKHFRSHNGKKNQQVIDKFEIQTVFLVSLWSPLFPGQEICPP